MCRKIFRKTTNIYRKNISVYRIIFRNGEARTGGFRRPIGCGGRIFGDACNGGVTIHLNGATIRLKSSGGWDAHHLVAIRRALVSFGFWFRLVYL
jgi:hypothetical protein